MDILGYLLAILIGVALGLIGGGGSILTVPVLVYVMGVDPVPATGYSLFIVGISALYGSYRYYKQDLVAVRTGVLFAIPAFIAVFLTRKYLIPALPETILSVNGYAIEKGSFLLILFALLMLAAAYFMIKHQTVKEAEENRKSNWLLVGIEGFVTGVITGLVGAGGGFIIIPMLVLFAGLRMKVAVGTSLLIIAIKSLIGFTGDLMNIEIDWSLLIIFSVLALLGIFLGERVSRKVKGRKLKTGFGYFLIVLAVAMLIAELV